MDVTVLTIDNECGGRSPEWQAKIVIFFFYKVRHKSKKTVESQTQRILGRRIGQRDVLVHIQHIRQESGRDTLQARTEQQAYTHRQQQPG